MENFEQNQNPEMQLMMMRQMAQQQGRNDSEWSTFGDIIEKYQKGELSGNEAIAAGQSILDKKQDYN